MNNKIAILGCGWLGLPLAKQFVKSGYLVHGSTTSEDKINLLKDSGITPFKIALHEDHIEGDMDAFLEGVETIIINVPPKLRRASAENYVLKIETLIKAIEKTAVKKVLFVSSTSVYGNSKEVITEESRREPTTESGRQLVEVEDFLNEQSNFKTTIVRFSGLIGDERNPANFLSGKENLPNPEAPVNLVHQNDCIGILIKILEGEHWNTSFNVAYPRHPSKETYYHQKAVEKNLEPPQFNHSGESSGKTIASDRVIEVLNYQFTTDI
ncbi:NAD(P)H-binding protein [Zhouia amylolytica]|uniref:NAD(P)-binding domain-containing protein n=1 Tax=Zhouia amylolytica AD3 TaxID=1286632 RepID=W2UIB1_9FLAO|nr:NAD(P)H-binding protein [Zhouia amylolytica]ETN93743.1 hypothetical protein P278_31530 [Zhouia amylolytica AD3]